MSPDLPILGVKVWLVRLTHTTYMYVPLNPDRQGKPVEQVKRAVSTPRHLLPVFLGFPDQDLKFREAEQVSLKGITEQLALGGNGVQSCL